MDRTREELRRTIQDVKGHLLYLMGCGFEEMPMDLKKLSPGADEPKTLEELRRIVESCATCPLLQERTQVVFGVGNPDAELMFVGEAPGRDEDLQGEPFVGRAGQLLTRIIEAMGMKRGDVYIANILKCRPPGNRNPRPEEIRCCEPFLIQQIRIIKPKIIVALGTFAAQTLLKTDASISFLRGKFHDYHGVKLMPTYHTAYLLRNPSEKKSVWEDMKLVMKELNRTNQGR